jgi:hypothetical protein
MITFLNYYIHLLIFFKYTQKSNTQNVPINSTLFGEWNKNNVEKSIPLTNETRKSRVATILIQDREIGECVSKIAQIRKLKNVNVK